MSLFANDPNSPSTGEVVNRDDSVLIAYDDLRIVNSKLVELDYQKQINNNLNRIIINDSIVIKDYRKLNDNLNKECKRAIHQRDICFGVAATSVLVSLLMLLK